MNKPFGQDQKSTILYDVGGWFLVFMIFGVGIVGVILDYFWNYLVFSFALRRLDLIIPWGRKIIFCLIITFLGLVIDFLYYEMAWGTLDMGPLRIAAKFPDPGSEPVLEILTIVIPLLLISAANFIVSKLLLKVTGREALVIGGFMGIFTAPWLILIYVVINW